MTGPQENSQSSILTQRLESATTELSSLHSDLYWLVQEQHSAEQQQALGGLDFKQIMDLKMAVDSLRDMLWKYIDAAALVDPNCGREASEASNRRRVTSLLQLLRDRLSRSPEHPPVSFIERVSAAIQEKLGGPGGKAA
ncbi:MAG TPA: hypothetical protein VNW97_01740 [Candidatus Saccharimonadales bacterium]|jgi:hypothetical protein|nr:hypothetical protein [Candidatus Saccharimonadales bacterium]